MEPVEQGTFTDAKAAVHSSLLLGTLRRDDLELVLAACRSIRAARHETLLAAGQDVVAIVVRGAAIASLTGADGAEVITELLGPGASWGLSVVFGHATVDSTVTALEPTEALLVNGRRLRRLAIERRTIATSCLRAVGAALATAEMDSARLAGTSARQRVVMRLVDLAGRWGRIGGDGAIHTVIPLTQDQLASWARTSRESTTAVLRELRTNGIIETHRREICICQPEALRRQLSAPGRSDRLVRELVRQLP